MDLCQQFNQETANLHDGIKLPFLLKKEPATNNNDVLFPTYHTKKSSLDRE